MNSPPIDFTRLAEDLAARTGAAAVRVENLRQLGGGAIQQNWAADLAISGGTHDGLVPVVIRCDAPSSLPASHGRAQEFALLAAAWAAGVTVPEPLWCGTREISGRDFFVMRRVSGEAAGHRLVKEAEPGGDRRALVARLGAEIARIQRITPTPALSFLERPTIHPALHFVTVSRRFLDAHHTPHPALEWGLRWLERQVPDAAGWSPGQLVLAHRDFRTGNYLVDSRQGLTAILDWEFAAWSHPLEDLGWFCARCWRFGRGEAERAAGGIGSREELLAAYNRESGRDARPADLFYWEVLAELRWALIAISQAERQVSGRESSLECALTAHIVPELEMQVLRMTGIDLLHESFPLHEEAPDA